MNIYAKVIVFDGFQLLLSPNVKLHFMAARTKRTGLDESETTVISYASRILLKPPMTSVDMLIGAALRC